MIFWNTLVMAIRQILRHKMRSTLTALGIVIGVAAVIAMVHLGQSATSSVTSQISSMGDNLLYVMPGTRGRGPGATGVPAEPFDLSDAEAVAAEVPGVAVAPTADSKALVVFGNQNWTTRITGTTPEFFDIRQWGAKKGRVLDQRDVDTGARVCVLGQTVEKELFGTSEALNEELRLGKMSCRVIGVLEEKGSSMGNDQDDIIILPIRTLHRRILGSTDVQIINISVAGRTTHEAAHEVRLIMRERRRLSDGEADDFEIRDMAEVVETLQSATSVLTVLLGAIAAVSLLVGGIGIMNIMLVSVTERTREIGIRLAIGARGREVLLQFLVESALLATVGGVIGIGLGIGGSYWAATAFDMPFVLMPEIISLAFGFSAVVGVLFGYIPARKAARLDPIEALRHE